MDIDMSKPCEMDNLVVAYFGQDCDIFDENCNFNNLLNEYLTTSNAFSLRMLLANIQDIEQQQDGVRIFSERYQYDFDPERWDLTAQTWINIVKQRLLDYMHEKGYSTELSHF